MSLDLRPKPPHGGAAEAESEARDPRARLRARRAKLKAGSTKLFVLPGYDSDNPEMDGMQLVARYRRFDYDELAALFTAEKAVEDLVGTNAQFLIDACVEILYRDKDGLHQPIPGTATRFSVSLETGESFATLVGVEEHSSVKAQMVAGFGDNELALNDHSDEVHRWMIDANAVDNETALGEA